METSKTILHWLFGILIQMGPLVFLHHEAGCRIGRGSGSVWWRWKDLWTKDQSSCWSVRSLFILHSFKSSSVFAGPQTYCCEGVKCWWGSVWEEEHSDLPVASLPFSAEATLLMECGFGCARTDVCMSDRVLWRLWQSFLIPLPHGSTGSCPCGGLEI